MYAMIRKMRFCTIATLCTYLFSTHVKSSAIPQLEARDGPVTSISGFDLTDQGGVRAAQYAAPVWLFARQEINGNDPCYPEGATDLKGGANPGTDGPRGPNPGEDCTDPLPAKGKYSPGGQFPNYITVTYCGDTWRINYSLYYVHDGAGLQGHKHDWESATVVLREDQKGNNMWHRDALILSYHDTYKAKLWKDIQSVNMDDDFKDESVGKNKMHPKVYVSFFKHTNFFEAKTAVQVYSAGSKDDEYRSDDWYSMGDPQKGDFVQGSTLDAFKDDYGGTTAPYWLTHKKKNKTLICDLPLP